METKKRFGKKNTQELFEILKKIDTQRAKSIDPKNPRRLIRAIEIVLKTGKSVPELEGRAFQFSVLEIGIKKLPEELKKLIKQRLLKRFKEGMINEVKKLHKSGVSFKRLEEFGLEYRFVAQYLQNKITHQEMIDKIQKESEHFAKKQATWFKRDKRIHWIKNYKEASKLLDEFKNK